MKDTPKWYFETVKNKQKNTGLNKTLMCQQLKQQQKKKYKGFFNNSDSIFVLLGEVEELENF